MYKKISIALLALMIGSTAWAQEDEEKKDGDKTVKISLSTDGISAEGKKDKAFGIEVFVLDLGINTLRDKTDYTTLTAAQKQYLDVPADQQNANLFTLRNGKSWNVNLWPVLGKWRIVNGKNQKIYLGTGVGLQMYNFRFNKPVTHLNEVNPLVYLDSVHNITKNKLGFTYLSVPLMVTMKTRLADKAWLVYGVGVTGGYRISSYTKQVSTQQGKQKNHDKFDFSDFNSCLTAEIGLNGYFRLYASYQLTPLHENALLDQRPLSIGLRFGGI